MKFEGADFIRSCIALQQKFDLSVEDLVYKLEAKMIELSKVTGTPYPPEASVSDAARISSTARASSGVNTGWACVTPFMNAER